MRPFVPIDYFVVLDRRQKGVGVEIERVGKKSLLPSNPILNLPHPISYISHSYKSPSLARTQDQIQVVGYHL